MTLENTFCSSRTNLRPDLTSERNKFFLLGRSSQFQNKEIVNHRHHKLLDRTLSDNTYFTSTSIAGVSNKTWSSANFLDHNKSRLCRPDVKFNLSNNVKSKAHLLQTHKPDARRHHRAVQNHVTSLQKHPGTRRNSIPAKEGVSSTSDDIVAVSKCTTWSKEIPQESSLPMPNKSSQSPHWSAAKRSERKELIPDISGPRLHLSPTWSQLDVSPVKDRRRHSADSRHRESTTTCSFFYFIRRKKKSSSRSPSPDTADKKSNRRNRGRSIISCSSGLRSERTSSPSDKGRRPSSQSLASSRLPLTSVSSNPPASVTSHAVPLLLPTSPPTIEKRQKYTSKSRSKHRRHRHRASKRALKGHPDDNLRHEDLPPHPSLYIKSAGKTSIDPAIHFTKPSINSTNNISSGGNTSGGNANNSNNIISNSEINSRSRRQSKTESSANVKSVLATTSSCYNRKDSKDNSVQAQDKSQKSASKTDLEEDSHYQYTTSSSDLPSRRSLRSQSLPSFRGEHYQPDADTKVISDAEDFQYSPTDMMGPLNLSLCGCGFLGMYHLGVVSCLSLRGVSFLERIEKVGGASAGALMAAVLVTARDKIEDSAEHVQNLAKEIRKKPLGALTPGYNFTRSLRYMLEDILPEDAHETAQGKLYVSLTNADTKKNEMMSEFKSREELIDALVASCYIPVYAGIKIPTVRGKKYIDGGLSDNLPRFDTGRTITVSPFDGKSDIGPKHGQEVEKKAHFINFHNQDIQVSMNNIRKGAHALFPPKRQTLQDYFEKGRYDASRFLIREGLYEISPSSQQKTVLYESSV